MGISCGTERDHDLTIQEEKCMNTVKYFYTAWKHSMEPTLNFEKMRRLLPKYIAKDVILESPLMRGRHHIYDDAIGIQGFEKVMDSMWYSDLRIELFNMETMVSMTVCGPVVTFKVTYDGMKCHKTGKVMKHSGTDTNVLLFERFKIKKWSVYHDVDFNAVAEILMDAH